MTDDGTVYQVRKVFDPKTFRVVEELVTTGRVKVSPPPPEVVHEDPVVETEGDEASPKRKRRRRSKKKTVDG